MKKAILSLVMFFLLSVLSYRLFFYLDTSEEKKQLSLHKNTTRLTESQLLLLQEGDFILRRGFGYFSDFIAKRLNTGTYDVTHAGILVKRNNTFYVIHSLSSDVSDTDGLQIQSLDEFLSYSAPQKLLITRIKNSSPQLQQKIADRAEYYLSLKIPFDHNGNYDNDTAFYCTELIWKILEKDLRHVTLPTEPDSRKQLFLSMSPMYSTDYFDIIINTYGK